MTAMAVMAVFFIKIGKKILLLYLYIDFQKKAATAAIPATLLYKQ